VSEQLSVRARFERFPATVKGAFILRGEDPDPHQVVFRQARVVAVGGGSTREVAVAATTLDVAPHLDVFVPFELVVTDLDPGWYGFECELEVDGITSVFPGERRFSVPWPRGTVRRGQVRVDRTIALGARTSVLVEQVDLGGDSLRLTLVVEPPAEIQVRLVADGRRVEVLGSEVDMESGRMKVTAFPVLRTQDTLRVELRGRGRGAEATLDIPLP
jgi:hypothetical protein